MCFAFSLVPATFWAIIGYFVLFTSARADGRVKTLGQALSVWVFVLAVLIPVVAAFVTLAGLCPIDEFMPSQM
jgi:hypothetical protein